MAAGLLSFMFDFSFSVSMSFGNSSLASFPPPSMGVAMAGYSHSDAPISQIPHLEGCNFRGIVMYLDPTPPYPMNRSSPMAQQYAPVPNFCQS